MVEMMLALSYDFLTDLENKIESLAGEVNVKAFVVIKNLAVIRKGIGIQARSTGD